MHFNIEMNGYDLNRACAVTMNGQSYIFRAVKQSSVYGQKYVVVLGRVRRSGHHSALLKPIGHILSPRNLKCPLNRYF